MKNKGQKLYKEAKKIIPGGTMLLSKRPEMFLPENWPSYFSKSKGCKVWDLDGNEYLDMSIMGIGTNMLGYGNNEVDNAVIDNIRKGNMSTLNCAEEVELARKLVEINPWATKVRLARSGGEANAIAIRIARASTKRNKVAICGYHGWHDWYLSANIAKRKNLDGHLLPGLLPAGVPKQLAGTTIPFEYNNFDQLERLSKEKDLAAIKMEVSRSAGPNPGYLEKVREVADKLGAILIFDECTSGFRECMGGLFNKFNVLPDMVMYGKTLGNGYAITAVVGNDKSMSGVEESFISSTFWTERIGPTAALKTLSIMEELEPWHHVIEVGKGIRKIWNNFGDKYHIPIEIAGLLPLSSFEIKHEDWLKFKTFITQEALKNNILAANSLYAALPHTEKELNLYAESMEPAFKIIGECINDNRNINDHLTSPECHSGFKRLN